jgi:hypothetical protein
MCYNKNKISSKHIRGIMKTIIEVIDRGYIDKFLADLKHYGYKSLVLNIIESVFSIATKFEATLKVVERFADHAGIDIEHGEYTLSQFIKDYGNSDYQFLAEEIFKNRQRTSAVSGILKAEAVVLYIKALNEFGIETTRDFLNYKNKDKLRNQIALIKGQSSGITFSYVLMLSGDLSTFKPDRHIHKFFEVYLEYGNLSENQLKIAFDNQLNRIVKHYPNFNIRMLDNLIWNFMKFEAV